MKKTKFSLSKFFLYLFLILGAVIMVFPFYWMITGAFKTSIEIQMIPPVWLPKHFNLDNFKEALRMAPFARYFLNSLIAMVSCVTLCTFTTILGAFAFSKLNFPGRHIIFGLLLGLMMVPFEILMLPLYKEIIKLHLVDTYFGVIVIGICNASTIFFFRQFLSGIPKDLLSAARIDGTNEYRIAASIILPLAKPAFASMGILSAMGCWNAILWPLLVLKGAEKFTLPIGLNTLLTPYGNNYDVLIAGSMFGILPIFVIFLFFQKYIIEGMTAGAVKG